jgi:ribonuclease VapC
VAAKSTVYVLDSFALLAYFQDEAGGRRVKAILSQAHKQRASVWLTVVNYGEVIYITEREQGLQAAHKLIAVIDQLPIAVVDVDRRLALAAAHVKAQHPLSYADAYAVALAQDRQATIVTADLEFRAVEPLVAIEWLPTA